MASIHKQQRTTRSNGKTRHVYRVRWRDPAGKLKSKTFPRRKDAEAFKAETEASANKGLYVDPHAGKVTVADYAGTWLASKRLTTKPGTVDLYAKHLEGHVRPELGDRSLSSVTRGDIQDFVTALHREGLAPKTVRSIYGVVRAIFNRAVDDERLGRSPCRNVELPRVPRGEVTPLGADAVAALADSVPPRFRAFIVAGAGTGMRWSELAGLTADRIDDLWQAVRVDRQLTRDAKGPEFVPVKTEASERTIPLPPAVRDALKAHVETYGHGPEGLVFTSERGAALNYGNFRRRVWDVARGQVEGMPDGATFHVMRHTYASLLIAAGVPLKVIQERLGHATLAETADTYGHLYPDEDERTRAAVDAALSGPLGNVA